MKIRTGFVSNSSSQSFVIAKCYMTEEQVKQFGDWLSKMQDADEPLYETYIDENDYYFMGEKSQHEGRITEFLNKIGIDQKYVGISY
jgi:hypothetical protein